MKDFSELVQNINALDPEQRRLFEALLAAEGVENVLHAVDYTPPRTPTEHTLAQIWGQALKREQIGIHDNFFELGGDSLLAIQVMLRVRESLQVDLPIGRFIERPTVATVAAEIERQANERSEAGDTAVPLPQIVPAPGQRYQPFPLTDVQYAYWIGRGGTLELGSVATHSYLELESAGLNLDRFERALQRLIERHDMLRAIVQADGQQRVLEQVPPYRIDVLDLRGQDPSAASAQLDAVRQAMSHQVLPADRWPLFDIRASLLDNQSIRLHVSVDLLLTDAWSAQILSQELTALYHDHDLALPALEISFRDYVLAEQGLRATELYQRSLAYWRDRLATIPAAPELPLAKDPASLAEPRFVRRRARLTAQQWQHVKQRATQAGLTPSTVLATAFAEVLAVWSKSPHFTLNLTFFNRLPLHPQVNQVVGDFTSLVLLEVNTSPQGGFEGRARRLQKQLWQDLDHRAMGGVEVLRALAQRQGGGPRALMPIVFTSTLHHMDAATADGSSAPARQHQDIFEGEDDIYGISQTSQVWLDHQVYEINGALVFNWDAVEELFPQGLLDEMFAAYQALLLRLADDPTAWLEHDGLLAGAPPAQLELRQAINATAAPLSSELLHSRFAEQAAQQPDQLAIIAPDRRLTYRDLAQRSFQLARWLRLNGARPNQLVAIVMEKGWQQALAALAVLQSGAAYLPIDPDLPSERRAFLLQHGQVQIALTQPWLAQRLDWPDGILTLPIGDEPLEDISDKPLESVQSCRDLAYTIFTSGSTGLPKGVMIDHLGALNTLLDLNERLDLSPHDRVLALSSLSFDLSVYDLFGSLAAGATIVFPDAASRRDPAHWQQVIEHQQVTIWNSVPALIEMLVEYLGGSGQVLPASLRHILLSGDWIPLSLPERIRNLHPTVQITSLGGATEASIWSILYPIEQFDPTWKSIPYGTPMRNQTFHVLNEHLEPCPVWVPGQLYIGGVGLALGYWRDPAKTAERFIPDPFATTDDQEPRTKNREPGINDQQSTGTRSPAHPFTRSPAHAGERLYKTGDLGRYLPDGTIEFLGREDLQVKVQGHRIELGEIEAALLLHPAVQNAVVAAIGELRGNKRLIAYLVQGPGARGQGSGEQASDSPIPELRDFLRARLPEYMVPATFVTLDTLPLTPNGKIDRRALPPPEDADGAARTYLAPRTELERQVAALFRELLSVEQVGLEDSFFELGGHSLLAIQLARGVRDIFQVELPLRTLFSAPTVANLAAAIGQAQQPALAPLPAVSAAPAERYQPFPLTDVQQAYWVGRSGIFELGNVATHTYNEFDTDGLDLERFERTWQRMIERHDMLRAIVLPDGQQQILEHVLPYRLKLLDLRGQDPQAVAEQLAAVRQEMSHQVLPSDCWPLFELRATHLDHERTRLHLSFDMLICDAWSIYLLLHEFGQLYQTPASDLPPLQLSFRDYVLAEGTLRQSTRYQQALDYWRKRLPVFPPAPELPLARSPGSLEVPHFTRRRARLEAEAWRRLKSRAAQDNLTPSGLLATAFAEVLTVWSKSARFTLNLTLFNRLPLHPQVDQVVGDFTSLSLLAVDNSLPGNFAARARRIQEQLWQDLDHRYVSGIEVLRWLSQREGGSRVIMPVVFTSTLTQDTADLAEVTGGAGGPDAEQFSVSQTPQVWLDHQVSEQAGALSFNWDAVEELFPQGLLDEMFAAYQALLGRLASDERAWNERGALIGAPAAQLELRQAINATAAPLSSDLLHSRFALLAAQQPDQLAIIAPDRRLTYRELAQRSFQLARWLRFNGARPNQLVAIVMEKGWQQAVAALAVLQSGAAYLPIDPDLPAERRAFLLQHGQVQIALTQPWLAQRLDWPDGILTLPIGDKPLEGISHEPLESVQSCRDLAYTIFTSGSTGLPKGVMIDHLGALNTLLDLNQRLDLSPHDRVLALSSLSFDLSVYDLFGTLAAGATIVFPDAASRRDPAHWQQVIEHQQVTIWNSVPALIEMLVEYLGGSGQVLPASLRHILLSGDWIPLNLPERIRTLHPTVQITSMGGATEASIWSILYPIEQFDPTWKSIPYGTPMVNQTFHVLNEHLEPCPVWVPGQLYIGGVGLALGYWRDPAKTAERFIPNPFATTDSLDKVTEAAQEVTLSPLHPFTVSGVGGRLYKTGDLGRYLPDGTIEFLGREDFQVKIQGHRVELGEIETALVQHPSVQAAAVMAVGEAQGARRLLAYVVPKATGPSAQVDAAPAHPAPQELIIDPIERLKFKLAHHGLRHENGNSARVRLNKPDIDENDYAARRSYRRFRPEPLALGQLSDVLSCLRQVTLRDVPLPKSRYGSAGSLYPVQVYLYIKPGRIEGLSGGMYYYHPIDHDLLLLTADAVLERDLYQSPNREIFDTAAFALFLVAQMHAIAPLYGEWARDFCLLEAGLMSQLLEMSAPAARIGLCQIGGFAFDAIRRWCALDDGHVYLHSLLGGAIDKQQAQLQALIADSSETRLIIEALQQFEGSTGAAQHRMPSPVAKGLSEKPPFDPAGRGNPAPTQDAVFQTGSKHDESRLSEELRGFLAGKLPTYMIPASFTFLDALPLTSNGKLDRRALLERGAASVKARDFAPPQTELEHTIATAWQAVLQVQQVSIHDSFFELGGNSIQLVKIHNHLSQILKRDIAIVKLFEHPTVSTLARYLSQEQDESAAALQQSHDRAQPRKSLMQRQRQARRRDD